MQKLGAVVYTVRSTVAEGWDAEFNRWQGEEHVPRLLQVPGYLSTQGYARLDRPRAFMNVWQIESRAAFEGEARTTAAHTPWRARMAEVRTEHSVDVYVPISGDGVAAGQPLREGPEFLVRYDLTARADVSEAQVAAGIDALVKALAADRATVYIRVLKALKAPRVYLLLHYLRERPAVTSVECPWCERAEAAPFAALER